MKIIQRIDTDIRHCDLLLSALDRHPGFFTDIWLNTAYGYPKNEDHRKAADLLAEFAARFREKGIRVSMQISNTLGHGRYMAARDCSGLVYENSPVQNMVGHDGGTSAYSFCWNDPTFRRYLAEHVRDYAAKIQPAEFWIDDDLRAVNHAPVEYGCYCDSCIGRFNQQEGSAYTRETLVREFLHGDISIRERYIQFIRSGIAELTTVLCQAVREGCPTAVPALQNGANGPYTGYGHDYILNAMYRTTGAAPMYRAGAGAYSDHNPNDMIGKMYDLAWQHSQLPDYVQELCPEIESTPDTALGKTMGGTALEAALNLANGATGISFAMLGSLPEKGEFYEQGFSLFSQQRPYWERLAAISAKSIHGGITYAHSRTAHLRPLQNGDSMDTFNQEYFYGAADLVRNGFATGFTSRPNGVFMLHPDMARQMSRQELTELLDKPVITDGETVAYLQSIGLDLGITAEPCDEMDILTSYEIFTEHPVNQVYNQSFSASFFAPGYSSFYRLNQLPENSEILGTYGCADSLESSKSCASAIIRTAKGGTWAVMAYGLWKKIIPSSQRDRLLNIIDYISDFAPAARILSPTQDFLLPRISKDTGKTLAISLLNCTIEPQESVQLSIRRPASASFRFVSQYDGEVCLPYEQSGDCYTVTLPRISPWSLATVFCD